MKRQSYTPQQQIAWYKTVIRHAAIRVNRKYSRWARESLTLNTVTDEGSELGDLLPSESAERDFQDSELLMALEVLPEQERLIVESIYGHGDTQREIAKTLNMSQSTVCKLHKKALTNLRRFIRDEMHTGTYP